VERVKVVEVPTERVVTVDRVVEKQVVVTVPTVEVVERRVEVPVMHERVVQVPVEATALWIVVFAAGHFHSHNGNTRSSFRHRITLESFVETLPTAST